MTNDNQVRRLLRRTVLSVALLLTAVPAALADPAGLGLNPATAEYAAYLAVLNRDMHPNQTMTKDEFPGCPPYAGDVQATLWNLNNSGAR